MRRLVRRNEPPQPQFCQMSRAAFALPVLALADADICQDLEIRHLQDQDLSSQALKRADLGKPGARGPKHRSSLPCVTTAYKALRHAPQQSATSLRREISAPVPAVSERRKIATRPSAFSPAPRSPLPRKLRSNRRGSSARA